MIVLAEIAACAEMAGSQTQNIATHRTRTQEVLIRTCLLKPASKRRRSIHPPHPRLRIPRIAPAMRGRALEIETIATLEPELLIMQRDLQLAAHNVQKLLTFVSV